MQAYGRPSCNAPDGPAGRRKLWAAASARNLRRRLRRERSYTGNAVPSHVTEKVSVFVPVMKYIVIVVPEVASEISLESKSTYTEEQVQDTSEPAPTPQACSSPRPGSAAEAGPQTPTPLTPASCCSHAVPLQELLASREHLLDQITDLEGQLKDPPLACNMASVQDELRGAFTSLVDISASIVDFRDDLKTKQANIVEHIMDLEEALQAPMSPGCKSRLLQQLKGEKSLLVEITSSLLDASQYHEATNGDEKHDGEG